MDLSKITFTTVVAFNNGKYPALVGVAPIWEYLDGKPSNNRVGTAYTVLLTGHRYQEAVIKTTELKEAISNQFIEDHGGIVPISAEGFTGKFYQYTPKDKTGENNSPKTAMGLSLKAQTVYPIDENGNMVPVPSDLPLD